LGMMAIRNVPVLDNGVVLTLAFPMAVAVIIWAIGVTLIGWGARVLARHDRPLAATTLAFVGATALNELVLALELFAMGGRSMMWSFPSRLIDARWLVGPLPLAFTTPTLGIYPVLQITMTAFALRFLGLRGRRPSPVAIPEHAVG
jgi:hypothetical protein